MIQSRNLLIVLSVCVINLHAMKREEKKDKFARAQITIVADEHITKEGYIKLPQDCISESEIATEVRSKLDVELRKAACICKDMMTQESKLKDLMEANSSFLFIPSCLSAGKSEASCEQSVELGAGELLLLQTLCEHGGNCTSCQDADGWYFIKNMSVHLGEQAPNARRCSPLQLQYHNEKKKLYGKINVSTLCKMYNQAGTQLNDTRLKELALLYITQHISYASKQRRAMSSGSKDLHNN